jgi:hypothetical protein
MTTHPNSLDLEAFACGEPIARVATHLPECTTCTAFVERLKGAAAPPTVRIDRLIDGAKHREQRRRFAFAASTVAVPLAAAAALLLFLRAPGDTKKPAASSAPSAVEAPIAMADPDPETTFKGAIQIAVIRERSGQQSRFTDRVTVRPGDRLRVEVALDREQAILAAVMGEDGSWLELMPEGMRRAGTHFSERSARVDTSPLRGTVIAGPPDAVARARATKQFEGVGIVHVEWEASQ